MQCTVSLLFCLCLFTFLLFVCCRHAKAADYWDSSAGMQGLAASVAGWGCGATRAIVKVQTSLHSRVVRLTARSSVYIAFVLLLPVFLCSTVRSDTTANRLQVLARSQIPVSFCFRSIAFPPRTEVMCPASLTFLEPSIMETSCS